MDTRNPLLRERRICPKRVKEPRGGSPASIIGRFFTINASENSMTNNKQGGDVLSPDERAKLIDGLIDDYFSNAFRTSDGEIKGYDDGHEIKTELGFAEAHLRAIADVIKRDTKCAAKEGVIVRIEGPVDMKPLAKLIDSIRKDVLSF